MNVVNPEAFVLESVKIDGNNLKFKEKCYGKDIHFCVVFKTSHQVNMNNVSS